jgi:hypothetical protein
MFRGFAIAATRNLHLTAQPPTQWLKASKPDLVIASTASINVESDPWPVTTVKSSRAHSCLSFSFSLFRLQVEPFCRLAPPVPCAAVKRTQSFQQHRNRDGAVTCLRNAQPLGRRRKHPPAVYMPPIAHDSQPPFRTSRAIV